MLIGGYNMNDKEFEFIKNVRQAIKDNDVNRFEELIGEDEEKLNMVTVFGSWLHDAATFGHIEVASKMIDMGINKELHKSGESENAISYAASKGQNEMIKFLYSKGVKLDLTDSQSNPLFRAIIRGHIDTIKLLLDMGVDITINYGDDEDRWDALQFAKETTNNKEVIKLVEEEYNKAKAEKIKNGTIKIEFNNKLFRKYVKKGIMKSFIDIIVDYKDEEVYIISLILDRANCMLGISANTKEYLEEQLKKDDDRWYYTFCEDEWEICNIGNEDFEKAQNLLKEYISKKDTEEQKYIFTDEFDDFIEIIMEACVDELEEVVKEKYFDRLYDHKLIVNFMMPENLDNDESIEIFSRLNKGKIVKIYKDNIEDFM